MIKTIVCSWLAAGCTTMAFCHPTIVIWYHCPKTNCAACIAQCVPGQVALLSTSKIWPPIYRWAESYFLDRLHYWFLVKDSSSDSEKFENINSDSCQHSEIFQVTHIKKVVPILPCEAKPSPILDPNDFAKLTENLDLLYLNHCSYIAH